MNQKFVPLRSYDNYLYANITLGMLQEAGIDCHIKDEYTVTIDPLLSPALGGMKLMVEASDMEQANALLTEAEKAYLQSIPCPVCKQSTLEAVTEITRYHSLAGKIKSLVLNGQEEKV